MGNRSSNNKLTGVPIELTMDTVNDHFLSVISGIVSRITPANVATVLSSLLATTLKRRKVRTVTASSVSILTSDGIVICDASSNAIATPFPSSTDLFNSTTGESIEVVIVRDPGSSNDVTITPNGSETIDGGSSVVLNAGSKSVFSDGSNLFTHG